MIQKVADLIYICTPFACFNAKVIDEGTVEVVHYAPFVQHELLNNLLGDEIKVIHKNSIDAYYIEDVKDGVNDGTVNGCLCAFKEFLKANMEEYITPEELDFTLSVSVDGKVTTSSLLITAMQDENLLPSQLSFIMDLLTYRAPVYQAFEKKSEGYTKFVEPAAYRFFVDTAVGAFEFNELFGSYGIKSEAIQGFIINYLHQKEYAASEAVEFNEEAPEFLHNSDVSGAKEIEEVQ